MPQKSIKQTLSKPEGIRMPNVCHDEEMDQIWTNDREIQRHSSRMRTVNWRRY